ncbi:MAG TPA: histidine kinase dimerization/phospho-acceptor domain-containing protein [Candidatus Aquilonibacter sp.]|nr:histidine kinase dimerization/phospho-acceptor domain-containing protein [Candidatus Aquilonibacter sp.]
MSVVAKKALVTTQQIALLGVADDSTGQFIAREAARVARTESMMPVVTTRDFAQLCELSSRFPPAAILLDESLMDGIALAEPLSRLAKLAPVVLIAPVERQAEIASIVASGEVDFVARTGDFAPLAIGLIERRLRAARSVSMRPEGWDDFPEDLGEIFRHEINNPLTGILGNAELLLSHRERLSLADMQRIQTVVDLAVRLRETTRRLSNAWESQRRTLRSA